MNVQRPKPKAFADDLLNSVGITPVKRARPSIGGSSNTGSHTPKPSTPSSSSRPYSAGPSRLHSSPSGHTPSVLSSPISGPATPSAPAIPFALRPEPYKILESLNDHLPLATSSQSAGTQRRIALTSSVDPERFNYRYQYERMTERSEVLDSLIDEAVETLTSYYSLPPDSFADPSQSSPEDVLVAGRICCEGEGVKLTETTCWLETSRRLGSGARIRLGFEKDMTVNGGVPGTNGFGFFPGELLGLRGRNVGGQVFTVSQILSMPPLGATYTNAAEVLAFQYGKESKQLGGSPMTVFVAAGPYTLDSDLAFAPFQALIKAAEKEKPDILLLMGPFIDAEHPLIKTGQIDELPSDLFRREISGRLKMLGARTRIVLVPSVRDLVSTHMAYPQGPLSKDDKDLDLPKATQPVSNPATFSVNEVVFGISALDTLFHLKNQEFHRKAEDFVPPGEEPADADAVAAGKDVMARTCRYLLRQKSFYPLFPAPLPGMGIEPINLDITHNDLVRIDQDGPDIIILPSRLKHFPKIVDSTIMINPSYLSRGNSPGTFARLTIHPLEEGQLRQAAEEREISEEADGTKFESEVAIEHRVWERCRVDIIKI